MLTTAWNTNDGENPQQRDRSRATYTGVRGYHPGSGRMPQWLSWACPGEVLYERRTMVKEISRGGGVPHACRWSSFRSYPNCGVSHRRTRLLAVPAPSTSLFQILRFLKPRYAWPPLTATPALTVHSPECHFWSIPISTYTLISHLRIQPPRSSLSIL